MRTDTIQRMGVVHGCIATRVEPDRVADGGPAVIVDLPPASGDLDDETTIRRVPRRSQQDETRPQTPQAIRRACERRLEMARRVARDMMTQTVRMPEDEAKRLRQQSKLPDGEAL